MLYFFFVCVDLMEIARVRLWCVCVCVCCVAHRCMRAFSYVDSMRDEGHQDLFSVHASGLSSLTVPVCASFCNRLTIVPTNVSK